MSFKALFFALPLVFSTAAFAKNECVLKAGTDLESYQVGERISLVKRSAARGTGTNLRTDVTNPALMKQTAVVEKLGYYQEAIRLTAKLPLSIVKEEVRRGHGNSCDYRGMPSGDPDIRCNDTNSVYWAQTVMTLQDSFGNVWTYWRQTDELNSAADVPADAKLVKELRKALAKECAQL